MQNTISKNKCNTLINGQLINDPDGKSFDLKLNVWASKMQFLFFVIINLIIIPLTIYSLHIYHYSFSLMSGSIRILFIYSIIVILYLLNSLYSYTIAKNILDEYILINSNCSSQ